LQEKVYEISGEFHKKTVYTSAFFYALLMEQVGQCAIKYMHQGRSAPNIEEDVTDIIVACLCYLNWIGKDADKALEKSLEKHRKHIQLLTATTTTNYLDIILFSRKKYVLCSITG